MADTRAATLEELRAVRHTLEELQQALPEQVKEEVARETVPRAELRGKLRRQFWRTLLVVVVVVVVAVGINRVTLIQSRDDVSEAVVTCFLRPQVISDAQAAACDRRFSAEGEHTYLRLQEQSKKATADFLSLRAWAKEQGWKPPK